MVEPGFDRHEWSEANGYRAVFEYVVANRGTVNE